jgi:hypothetical protein
MPGVDPIAAGVAAHICESCPVQRECAVEAVRLLHTEPGGLYGTWAGISLNGPESVRACSRQPSAVDRLEARAGWVP